MEKTNSTFDSQDLIVVGDKGGDEEGQQTGEQAQPEGDADHVEHDEHTDVQTAGIEHVRLLHKGHAF
jgi:hypothetical protein